MYASSRITSTCDGTRSSSVPIASLERWVPVGLFGLQTTINRVCSVTAAAIASRSWTYPSASGTVTSRASVVAARCGYIENDGHA